VDFAACRLFDRWAATGIDDVPAAAVIACEISALTTFEEAKRRGRLAILDAPSIHHLAQDRLHGTTDPPALHRRIVAVKEREIALADHILTVSELARQTYIEAGVPAAKVHALPLGADLARFAPRDRGRQDAATRKGEIVFLFAGASIRRKGFDILLEAFSRLETTAPFARLRVVGGPGDLAHLRASYRSRRIAWVGPLSQDGLARELRAADCLVLPSRNDSFGMVVAEALASGIPAIVSEMVGAKDLLTEGETGWIVPVDDVERLAAVMLDVAVLPDLTGTRGLACRRAAEQATWAAYHHRLSALLWKILAEVRP
jgi:glycosyltransferase involved in cell wall biosynthesis